MIIVLWQVIGNVEPWCLGANENMLRWADTGAVNKCAHRHMRILSLANNRIEKRTALSTMHVMCKVIAVYHCNILAFDKAEIFQLYARQGFEC